MSHRDRYRPRHMTLQYSEPKFYCLTSNYLTNLAVLVVVVVVVLVILVVVVVTIVV